MSEMEVVSALALIGAVVLAWWAASLALLPLKRVGHLIDEIDTDPRRAGAGDESGAVERERAGGDRIEAQPARRALPFGA